MPTPLTTLQREALARDAAHGAALLRRAVLRAAVKLGGLLALGGLAVMFVGAAARGNASYLISSRRSALADGPGLAGSLLTVALLGLGGVVLGIGVIRRPAEPGRAHPGRRTDLG